MNTDELQVKVEQTHATLRGMQISDGAYTSAFEEWREAVDALAKGRLEIQLVGVCRKMTGEEYVGAYLGAVFAEFQWDSRFRTHVVCSV